MEQKNIENKAFWIGLAGGILALCAGTTVALVPSETAFTIYAFPWLPISAASSLLFGSLGITGAYLYGKHVTGGTLMIISAFGVLLSAFRNPLSLLAFALLLIAGIISCQCCNARRHVSVLQQ